jgi:hypothetical protein
MIYTIVMTMKLLLFVRHRPQKALWVSFILCCAPHKSVVKHICPEKWMSRKAARHFQYTVSIKYRIIPGIQEMHLFSLFKEA